MSPSRYASPTEAFRTHVEACAECRDNPFGMCAVGFRLLGDVSRMHQDDGQLELLPAGVEQRPLVRMFLGREHKAKWVRAG